MSTIEITAIFTDDLLGIRHNAKCFLKSGILFNPHDKPVYWVFHFYSKDKKTKGHMLNLCACS